MKLLFIFNTEFQCEPLVKLKFEISLKVIIHWIILRLGRQNCWPKIFERKVKKRCVKNFYSLLLLANKRGKG